MFIFREDSRFLQDGSVGIAISYELDDRGLRVQFLVEPRNLSLLHSPQTGSVARPRSYTTSTGGKEAEA
jgi:hypothetical protein